jgi:hypothetical protein
VKKAKITAPYCTYIVPVLDVNGLEGGGKTLEHLDGCALAKGSALDHLSPQFPINIKRSVVGLPLLHL